MSWYHTTQQWHAQIKEDWKVISLGFFDAEIEAAQTYDAAALIIRPDCARLNFPNQPQPAHIVELVKRTLAKHGLP